MHSVQSSSTQSDDLTVIVVAAIQLYTKQSEHCTAAATDYGDRRSVILRPRQ